MNNSKRKKLVLVAAVSIVIVILAAAVLLKISKKERIEVEEIGIKEIVGKTIGERLLSHNINLANAKITKIENVDMLRQSYSAIFKDAENGNYVVEMPERILIYDFEHDEIIAEFFVQNIDLGEMGIKG